MNRARKGECEREGCKMNPLQHVPCSHPSCRGRQPSLCMQSSCHEFNTRVMCVCVCVGTCVCVGARVISSGL